MTHTQSKVDRIAHLLILAAISLELSLGANALTWVGVPYVSEGGNFLLKIHPGTWLISIAFLLIVMRSPWRTIFSEKLLGYFIGMMTAGLLYLAVLTGAGNLIVILDTFLPAGMLALVLTRAGESQIERLRLLLRVLISANAVLALVEMTLHVNVVPLYLNDAVYHPQDAEFRPTGLFDHPLTGGIMTLMGLALVMQEKSLRLVYQGVLWAALFAYGGRMALAAALCTTLVYVATRNMRLLLLRDRRSGHIVATVAAASLVMFILGLSALQAGLGTRLVSHLYWDNSAQVRVAQWHLLYRMDVWQLIFGTRRSDLIAMLTPLWLGSGVEVIENFWLLMFVNFGLIGFPFFLTGFAALLIWSWRRTGLQGRLLLCSVTFVASTSNSLGRKSSVLTCMMAAILCLRPSQKPATRKRKTSCIAYGPSFLEEAQA